MEILLTGATGFLGGYVLRSLREAGREVCCLVRSASRTEAVEPYASMILRYTEYCELYGLLERIRPETVIHMAGRFLGEHGPESIEDLLDSNIKFPTVLLDAAHRAGCRRLLNTGTCWQRYGGAAYDPVNLYAASKQAFEDCAAYYVRAGGWTALTLQIFDTYGSNDPRRKVLNLVHALKDKESLDLSPGAQKLYFCHADDVAAAYRRALELLEVQVPGTARTWAVRGDTAYTLREILETYLDVSGRRVVLNWGARPCRDREFMDPEGLGEPLPGWKPRYGLRAGLEKYEREWTI